MEMTIALDGAGRALLAKLHALRVRLTVKQGGRRVGTRTLKFRM
jgi:hypothetical protein